MTPPELIGLARSQPDITIDRLVRVRGPELQTLLGTARPLRVSDLAAHPDQHTETRQCRYGHVLGAPLSSGALTAWQGRNPRTPLPTDVAALLLAVDGIHLWANLETGRAYFGILPLAEWQTVREAPAAALFNELPEATLVMSYHENSDYFLLLVPGAGFTWFDPQSPENSTSIGASVAALLDWWWRYAQELDPRRKD